MKRSVTSAILLLCAASTLPVQAQPVDPVADTTDWRDYFPMQVGNAWEHKIGNVFWGEYPERYERREIIGDTVIGGASYFVHQVSGYNADLELIGSGVDYLRYDTIHATVVSLARGDSTNEEQPWPDPSLTCDLSAAFYSDFECYYYPEAGRVSVYGSYNEDTIFHLGDLESSIAKLFTHRGSGFGIGFIYGVGVIEVEADFEIGYRNEAIFVRLDGKEYGRSEVATAVEDGGALPGSTSIIAAYPNPFQATTKITYDLSSPHDVTVSVYDVVGRRAVHRALGWRAAGPHTIEVDGSGLASGVYLVRISSGDGESASEQIILQR